MKRIAAFLLLSSFTIVNAQKRNVIEPSAEYVMHLNAAKSHNVELIKNKKQLDKLAKQGKSVLNEYKRYY